MARQPAQSGPSEPTRSSKRYTRPQGPQARAENQSVESGSPGVRRDHPHDSEPTEVPNSGHLPGLDTFSARVDEGGVPSDGQEQPTRSAEPAPIIPPELNPEDLYYGWRSAFLETLERIFFRRLSKETGTPPGRADTLETLKQISDARIYNEGTYYNLPGAPLMMDLGNSFNSGHSFLNVYPPEMPHHQQPAPAWESLGGINGDGELNNV